MPPALLCAAFGLLLAYAPRRMVLPSLLVMTGFAVVALFVPAPPSLEELVFAGCWGSIVTTALLLHWPGRLASRVLLAVGANAGFWAGAVTSLSSEPLGLALALPWALICLPAAYVLGTPARLGVKIVGSWLVAIAILAAALPMVETPGYKPDHLQ